MLQRFWCAVFYKEAIVTEESMNKKEAAIAMKA